MLTSTSMRALLLALIATVSCADEQPAPAPDAGLPICAELGCDNTLCPVGSVCTCNGEQCLVCPLDDLSACGR